MNFLMAAAFLRNKKKKLMNKNRKLKEKVANPKTRDSNLLFYNLTLAIK